MLVPELLSPAGTLKSMRYAFAYGADAVYAGQPRYSLRVRNNEFNLATLDEAIKEAHALSKQFYLVSNIAPHNSKLKTYIKDMAPIIEMQPDAIIMSDPGLIMLMKEHFPEQTLHLSVQANAVNWATVKFWQQQGISRVILSRELSLDEIDEIKQQVPEMELEVFVHGALCMAYSGRCLLSGYLNKRDPNQGSCTNACRWKYQAHEGKETETGDVIPVAPIKEAPSDEIVLLQEKEKPGEYMPAFEDEHGTYIMNSRDLRAIQHVERLVNIGVDSLKIEGRTKSFYYVARTAQVYRRAIELAVKGEKFDPDLFMQLDGLANRGYTDGFLQRHNHSEYQNYSTGNSVSTQQQFVGDVIEHNNNRLTIDVKNKFSLGDKVQLMTPEDNIDLRIDTLLDKQGENISVAKGSGHIVQLPITKMKKVKNGILLRYLDEGQTTRNPHSVAS